MYDQNKSLTSSATVPQIPDDNASVSSPVWYSDTLSIGPNLLLSNYSFGSPGPSKGNDFPFNTFSLEPESTFIRALQQQGHIASNVWSFWWGADTTNAQQSQDGSIVFGGYDRAKVSGQNYTGPLHPTSSCSSGIQVNVRDILLTFPNGTQTGIVSPGQSGFTSCIHPDWAIAIDLNSRIYDQFEQATDTKSIGMATDSYFYSMIYATNSV